MAPFWKQILVTYTHRFFWELQAQSDTVYYNDLQQQDGKQYTFWIRRIHTQYFFFAISKTIMSESEAFTPTVMVWKRLIATHDGKCKNPQSLRTLRKLVMCRAAPYKRIQLPGTKLSNRTLGLKEKSTGPKDSAKKRPGNMHFLRNMSSTTLPYLSPLYKYQVYISLPPNIKNWIIFTVKNGRVLPWASHVQLQDPLRRGHSFHCPCQLPQEEPKLHS